MQGLIGKKLGMTQIYDEKGQRVSVTVIEAGPCVVTQLRTRERDGYEAAQLGFGERDVKRMKKAASGHLKASGGKGLRLLREFSIDKGEECKPGDQVTVAGVFTGVTHVDVSSISKGQGFQGVVKRYRMAGQPATHGSTTHRRIGAIGQRAVPGNVHKGHRMPGHMGNVRVTTQNLRVVAVDADRNLLLVGGAVSGPTGTFVEVRKALKKAGVKS